MSRCRVQAVVLACLALAGFGGSYVLAGGSFAAVAGTATLPSPDPPPPTTRHIPPQPPPPPPPPPVETYTPPPSPAVTRPRVQKQHREILRRPEQKAHAVPVASDWRPRPPDALGSARKVAAVETITSGSASPPTLLPLLLIVVLAVTLLAVAVAATPPGVLPRSVVAVVDERREAIIFGGLATAVSVGLGLAIAFLGS